MKIICKLMGLKKDKPSGHDGLHVKALSREAAEILVFHNSLDSGKVPGLENRKYNVHIQANEVQSREVAAGS